MNGEDRQDPLAGSGQISDSTHSSRRRHDGKARRELLNFLVGLVMVILAILIWALVMSSIAAALVAAAGLWIVLIIIWWKDIKDRD